MAEGSRAGIVVKDGERDDLHRLRNDARYFQMSREMLFDDNVVHGNQSLASGSMTELSSLSSMGEDEYDLIASQTVQNMLDDVETMLYNPVCDKGCPSLAEECENWTSTFPHMRITGQQIKSCSDEGYQFHQTAPLQRLSRQSGTHSPDHLLYKMNRLTLSGKHVAAMAMTSLGDEDIYAEEEIIAQHGVVEEILAYDSNSLAEIERSLAAKGLRRGIPPITPVSCLRDSVVSNVFNEIKAQIGVLIVPVIHRLIQAKLSGESRVKSDKLLHSWKQGALRMMQPPSGIGSLYHDDPDTSPLTETPSSGSNVHSVSQHSVKSLHSSPNTKSFTYGTEASTLDGLLTVRSKALLVREKSNLTLSDSVLEGASVDMVPGSRPKTSISAIHSSQSSRSGSAAYRQTGTVLRPGRLIPLLEEDRHKAELQQALGTSLALGAFGRPNFITVGLNPGQPLPVGHSSGLILVAPGSLNTSSTPVQGLTSHIASVATTTTSGAVMRSLLPPISHKRDATSANINRALPVSKTAVHVRSTSSSSSKETRLLPARERDKTVTLDFYHHRPSTTHSLYRSETSFNGNRRSTAVNSRHLVTAFDNKRNNSQPLLNVTGSSIAHVTESMARSPEFELVEHAQGLHASNRRFRIQNIAVT